MCGTTEINTGMEKKFILKENRNFKFVVKLDIKKS